MRKLVAAGIVLLVVGLFLSAGFWPLFSVNGVKLAAAKSGNTYEGYSPGSQVLLHDKVLNVSYVGILDNSFIQVDSGNPNNPLLIVVQGDARGRVAPGDVIYATAILQSGLAGIEYWQIPSPGYIQPSWPLDALFYGTAGLGALCLVAAALTGRKTSPQG